jgi:hypothetical protein
MLRIVCLFIAIGLLGIGVPAAQDQTYDVCRGQFKGDCPRHDVWIECGDPNAWARQACTVQGSSQPSQYQMALLSSRGGHRCGYSVWRITCR